MALQNYGQQDMVALLAAMNIWCKGSMLEKRAAAAGLCEPALLDNPRHVEAVLTILNQITGSILEETDRKSEGFQAMRKGLAYCWSVAAAAHPKVGKTSMQAWFDCPDKDIRWIMVQNLKKKRLERMDPEWTSASLRRLTRR